MRGFYPQCSMFAFLVQPVSLNILLRDGGSLMLVECGFEVDCLKKFAFHVKAVSFEYPVVPNWGGLMVVECGVEVVCF